MTPQHEAALAYASRGWHVFPLRPGGKFPLITKRDGGSAHLDATTDPALINRWWSDCPNANVGISLAPSNLFVLDVDTSIKKDGTRKRGRESLAEIDSELTDTQTVVTGRGGMHALYTRPPDLEPRRVIDFKDGLDLLGEGHIVASPSVLAETGKAYVWNPPRPIAPLPPFLQNVARAAREKVQLNATDVGAPLPEGGRNVALFRLGAALRDSGIGPQALAAALHWENQNRCKPPIDEAELATIVQSVLTRVQPSRDVAMGAVIAQEVRDVFTPEVRSYWVGQVASQAVPPTRFYATGFPQLDEKTGGGVATRQVFGVIGPPSSGKSAFVDTLATNLFPQVPVLLVSTELEREQLFIRLACKKLGVPWRDGIKGLIPRADMLAAVQGMRIKLIGCDDLDRGDPLGHIWLEADRLAQECGVPPVVIVDYVQLMARGAGDQVRLRVGELTMKLRVMAQTLDLSVIAVFTTSRSFYGGKGLEQMRKIDDPTQYLSAAKESGDIEYDCATMVYLDVDKNYEGQPKPARIVITRCRMGDIGFVGARAKLDVGLWYGDPSAAAELAADERFARVEVQRSDKDCERLLDTISRMTGRPWREIKMACGLSYPRADTAKAKLIEQARIEFVKETYYDSLHREQKREVIRVRSNEPPPDDVGDDV